MNWLFDRDDPCLTNQSLLKWLPAAGIWPTGVPRDLSMMVSKKSCLKLLDLAAASTRFKNLNDGCVNDIIQKQFAALIFKIKTDTSYVLVRGTDDSSSAEGRLPHDLYGSDPAQKMAARHLQMP